MSLPGRDLSASGSNASGDHGSVYEFGPFRLDPGERLLLRDDQPVAITPKAFDLLVYLVQRPGRLADKHALMAALWPDTVVEEANLAYNVSALRKALGDGHDGEQIIQTVPTKGYRLVATVRERREEGSPLRRSPRRRRALIVAVLAAASLGFLFWRAGRSDRSTSQVVRFELVTIAPQNVMTPAISPDGSRVVYAATKDGERVLHVRRLDSLQAMPLPGTAGAEDPFFSPDGRVIGYFVGRELMTMDLATNAVTKVCRSPSGPIGATWGPDARIYFGVAYTGILAVPAGGGTPVPVTTTTPGESYHGWPQVLPGGRHLVLSAWRSDDLDHAKVDVAALETGERRTVLNGAVGARYLAPGHLAYLQQGTLYAVRFDPEARSVQGPPLRVLTGVGSGPGADPFYAISATGTLVYHPGSVLHLWTELLWSSPGVVERIAAPPGYYVDPSLSPDDRRLAVAPNYGDHQDIYVHEFARGTWTRLTTQAGVGAAPVWHPLDPDAIVFTSVRRAEGALDLFKMPADGSGPAEVLHTSAYPKYATSGSRAAGLLAFMEIRPDTWADVWLLDVRGRPAARPLVQGPSWEGAPSLSPDGRWVAYDSDESGRFQVYVRPISGAPGKWQVSTEGGARPRWSRDGRRIMYRTPAGIMAVEVTSGATFTAGKPETLVDDRPALGGAAANYDITPDGGRVLFIRPAKDQPGFPLVVVQNWFAEVRAKLDE